MSAPTPPSPLASNNDVTARFTSPAPPIDPTTIQALRATGVALTSDERVRHDHGRDWWPISIGWAAQGRVAALPDVVMSPASTQEVADVVKICNDAGVAVTPMAGRSGVCGGALALRGGVALDLTGLDRVIDVDETSCLVRTQAGVFGPELEAHLAATGQRYTLGHWPQSFDISTVGGWLACRGAGQYSTRYGKIEDMVRGLTVVLADGTVVETDGAAPRGATGPNLTQLFVGSEGTLGIITEATLAIHPRPHAEWRGAFGFSTFHDGLETCRRILQRGATPAVLRLYDEIESQRNFDVSSNVLIVLDEADAHLVEATRRIVDEETTNSLPLDISLVGRWLDHRNDVTALAPLWGAKVVVDTIEMAGDWAILPSIAEEILGAIRSIEGTVLASLHQSHAYVDGACLYFTFAGRVTERGDDYGDLDAEETYYRACWDAATHVIESHGAAISHHHGIGLNRARYLASALGESFGVLESIKHALDPKGILNPGKLGLGEVTW